MKSFWSLVFTLLLIGSMVLTACGPTPEPEVIEKVVTKEVEVTVKETVEVEVEKVVEKVVTATPAPVPVEIPGPLPDKYQEDAVIVVGVPAEPSTVDPRFSAEPRATTMRENVYSHPFMYGWEEAADGVLFGDFTGPNLKPWMVESWEVDGADYIYHIRPGMMSHAGNELTAESLKYEAVSRHEQGRGWIVSAIGGVENPPEDMVVVDDYTLKIKTNGSRISPMGLWNICFWDMPVVEENTTDEDPWVKEWASKNTAAGGPFIIEKWDPGVEVVLVRNEDYFGPEPRPSQVVFRIIPSAADRGLLLEQGAIDIAEDLSVDQLESLQGKEGVTIVSAPTTSQFMVSMNVDQPPFDDVKVRQALQYATSQDDIIEGVLNGRGKPYVSYIPTGVPCSNDSFWTYDTDVEKAKALLAEAGYADGFETEIYVREGDDKAKNSALVLQSNLAEVGVTLNIEILDSAAFTERARNRELPMVIDDMLAWTVDPGYIGTFFYSDTGTLNYGNWHSDRAEEIFAETTAVQDLDVLCEAYDEFQELIMEDHPWILLAQPDYQIAMRDNLNGYIHYTSGIILYEWMSKDVE